MATLTVWPQWTAGCTAGTNTPTAWYCWNGTATAVTSTAVQYEWQQPIWGAWTNSTTVASTTITLAWENWATEHANISIVVPAIAVAPQNYGRVVTAGELAAEQARHQRETAEANARYEKLRIAYEAASARAEALLRECLKPTQLKEYTETKTFNVQGASGVKYRIHVGSHGNVFEMHGEQRVAKLCCAPVGNVPYADAMLAQKLMLEHAETEREFRATANITRLVPAVPLGVPRAAG